MTLVIWLVVSSLLFRYELVVNSLWARCATACTGYIAHQVKIWVECSMKSVILAFWHFFNRCVRRFQFLLRIYRYWYLIFHNLQGSHFSNCTLPIYKVCDIYLVLMDVIAIVWRSLRHRREHWHFTMWQGACDREHNVFVFVLLKERHQLHVALGNWKRLECLKVYHLRNLRQVHVRQAEGRPLVPGTRFFI